MYIAVISGRNVENVKKMVGIEGITYAGNHGLEILHPDGSKFIHPMPIEYEDKVTGLLKALQENVRLNDYYCRIWMLFLSCDVFNRFVMMEPG